MARPDQVAIDYAMSADSLNLRIAVSSNGTKIPLVLDSADLEELIAALAAHRAQMADGHPDTIDPGSRHPVVTTPYFGSTTTGGPPGLRIMTVRHPGFGWLCFGFPNDKALEISGLMLPDLCTEKAA